MEHAEPAYNVSEPFTAEERLLVQMELEDGLL